MIMFHFFIAPPFVRWPRSLLPLSPQAGRGGVCCTAYVSYGHNPYYGALSFGRDQLGGLQRLAHAPVALDLRERRRHVLGAAVPQLNLHQRVGARERVSAFGLGALGREQVEAAAAVDRLARLR